MRARFFVAAGTAALALTGSVLAASPAFAGDTTVTFTLAGGSLTLTAPSSATLTPSGAIGVTGSSATGTLGSTNVTDARGTALHSVSVTMSSTAFSRTGGGTSIPSSGITGYSGVATPTGTAVAVPTATGQSLDAAGSTILTLNSVLGAGGADYNPTVSVTIPAGTQAGSYTATVTQTVA
ncbi:MAG: hypothetical protein QOI82_1599 [Actinomycetota bacterium]|jgi:hypothetical protein|nr:hypothetical protein [Actinomycetota bacterium]